jgi:CheY-like chemotaxis protein
MSARSRQSLCVPSWVIDMAQRILIVEPNPAYAAKVAKTAEAAGWVATVHATFEEARRDLAAQEFDTLIGNVRLDGFNGIHLAYLAKERRGTIAVIVYSTLHDPVLVREARSAGAFYEPMESLVLSLPAYLAGPLPSRDRRVDLPGEGSRAAGSYGRRASDRMKLALVLNRRDDPPIS